MVGRVSGKKRRGNEKRLMIQALLHMYFHDICLFETINACAIAQSVEKYSRYIVLAGVPVHAKEIK